MDYELFIRNLNVEQQLIKQINKVLKNKGLSDHTIDQCKQYIQLSEAKLDLKIYILNYLQSNRAKLSDSEKIICSSDIIESIFGKFKYRLGTSPSQAITQNCLSIAIYGKKIDLKQIKNAMQQVKIDHLLEWRKKNIPISLLQQKIRLFKKVC